MRGKRGISTLVVAGIVVAIIVIVAVGISYYYLMPAPEPEEPEPVVVSTLKFTVDLTYDGTTDTFTYYVKGIDADNITMRMETTIAGEEYVVIVNEEQAEWADYGTTINGYIDRLEGWTEGDVTYTDSATGNAVKIYNIQVNPTLADSLFEAES